MADIELVIKMPEHYYENNIKKELPIYLSEDNIVAVLPKGHGRLIILSEDAVKREQVFFGFSCQKWISDVSLSNATVAIIEADKIESEEI